MKTAAALLENGATAVYACCSHPVFSRSGGRKHFEIRHHAEVVVTNTIPLSEAAKREPKIQSAHDRGTDWTGDSVHSRGNFGQQIIL